MNEPDAYVAKLRGKVASSACVMSLAPGADPASDAKFVYETGMAVLLDKPIILVLAGAGAAGRDCCASPDTWSSSMPRWAATPASRSSWPGWAQSSSRQGRRHE